MEELTHFNQQGQAHMVDIGKKSQTHRIAVAEGYLRMQKTTIEKILAGTHKKGDVLGIARIAGIMAAKKTAELIPLCHTLALSHIDIDIQTQNDTVHCIVRAETTSQTGVEMEALQATQTTLITIYDMCKSIDRGMVMENIRLLEKSGGKSGHWQRQDDR